MTNGVGVRVGMSGGNVGVAVSAGDATGVATTCITCTFGVGNAATDAGAAQAVSANNKIVRTIIIGRRKTQGRTELAPLLALFLFLFFFARAFLPGFFDDLLRDMRGHGVIVTELHRKVAAALRHRTQVRSIALNFR